MVCIPIHFKEIIVEFLTTTDVIYLSRYSQAVTLPLYKNIFHHLNINGISNYTHVKLNANVTTIQHSYFIKPFIDS